MFVQSERTSGKVGLMVFEFKKSVKGLYYCNPQSDENVHSALQNWMFTDQGSKTYAYIFQIIFGKLGRL